MTLLNYFYTPSVNGLSPSISPSNIVIKILIYSMKLHCNILTLTLILTLLIKLLSINKYTHTHIIINCLLFSYSQKYIPINKSTSPSPLLCINHFITISILQSAQYPRAQPRFSALVYKI